MIKNFRALQLKAAAAAALLAQGSRVRHAICEFEPFDVVIAQPGGAEEVRSKGGFLVELEADELIYFLRLVSYYAAREQT